MAHWRSLLESKYLSHYDLDGKDCTLTIREIRGKQAVVGQGGQISKKALFFFDGKERAAVFGVAAMSTIENMYGEDWAKWVGKKITLYPTTTSAGGKTVGCIRVRPKPPGEKAQREPGSDG